jgi:hypothetical protein
MKESDEELAKKHRRNALIGAFSALGITIPRDAYKSYRQYEDIKKHRASKKWENFKKKLKPGDIMFSRNNPNLSGNEIGGLIKEQNLITGTKGGIFYHPSIYAGGNRQYHSQSYSTGLVNNYVKDAFSGERRWGPRDLMASRTRDWVVYRPPEKYVDKALSRMKEAVDNQIEYKERPEQIKHGLKHLLGIKERPLGNLCKAGKNGLLCSEAVSEAYPNLFKDRLMSPEEMMRNKKLQFIGRYNPLLKEPSLATRLSAHLMYPTLKNLKWAVPGAAAGYLGSKLINKGEK